MRAELAAYRTPEPLGTRRCSSAGAREVFLLAQSWRHLAAGAGWEAAAETRSALERLRGSGQRATRGSVPGTPLRSPPWPQGGWLCARLGPFGPTLAPALQWPLAWSRSPESASTRQPGQPFYSLDCISTSLPPSLSLLASFPSQRHRPQTQSVLNRAQRRGPGRGRGRPPRWQGAKASSIWGRKTLEGRCDRRFVRLGLMRGEGTPFHCAFFFVGFPDPPSLLAAPVRERSSRAGLQFPEGTVGVES